MIVELSYRLCSYTRRSLLTVRVSELRLYTVQSPAYHGCLPHKSVHLVSERTANKALESCQKSKTLSNFFTNSLFPSEHTQEVRQLEMHRRRRLRDLKGS